eukprot:TRINITY_DN5300_c0_g1_i1.p1 TRINITY_DN5300_c0_g1~~TRINITY_DN5300_c0_g1_i1.p1  ORF type:complete len:205 (-),score=57.07 TRINITY_DN5300_c0_g1_i1:140-754(-)
MSRLPRDLAGYHLSEDEGHLHIEAFLDILCPFSKKAYFKIKEVIGHYAEQGTKLQFRFVNNVQPWHPQAYYIAHVIAATNLASRKKRNTRDDSAAMKLIDKFFEQSDNFSDSNVSTKTPKEIYSELTTIAVSVVPEVTQDEIDALLKDEASVLYTKIQIKYGRQNSVHVTPTVAINGLIDTSVSSSWGLDEWKGLIEPLLAANK